MSKVNGAAAIERVARSLCEIVDDDDSDGEIEFMPQPAAAAAAGVLRPTTRLPHRRAANATRAARVVHRNNRSNAAGGGSSIGECGGSLVLSASSSPAKSGSCSPRRDNNQRIKELVLSQFDLIKKQSDDIVRKDQQLRDLQRDNEKLKARLKVLELKNVEHEKKTKLRPPGRHTQATETELRDCVNKDLNVAAGPAAAQQQAPPAAADCAAQQEVQSSSSSSTSSRRLKRKSTNAKRARSGLGAEEAKAARPPAPPVDYLTSARPFFVLEGEEFVRREREEVRSILRFAEVPGWRERAVAAARGSQPPPSEATDDDAYLKRHGKPEVEEKRRKRWDMQRIREQRHIERLKLRYDQANASVAVTRTTKPPAPPARVPPACKGKGGERCCALGTCLLEGGAGRLTLMNDPLGITHILVAEPRGIGGEEQPSPGISKETSVPVSAFGHRIPDLAPASASSSSSSSKNKAAAVGHFRLPWSKSAG